LDWFRGYLTKRKQFVHYGGLNSKVNTTECGILQGSVLGPLLFIIYTNDLSDTLNLVKSILFADDTTLYYSSPHIPDPYEIMNEELDSLTDWLRANKLSQNVSKTNYMIFSNINSKQHAMEINLTNTTITKTNCVKFLGVFIDENLNWNELIKVIKKKIFREFFIKRESNTS